MTPKAISVTLCAGLIGLSWNSANIGQVVHPPVRVAGLEASETNASASLLGQFRTSFSSWMWTRTDLYLHGGVEMRQMTAEEVSKGVNSSKAASDGHEQLMDEESVTTVVPAAERDFRGIFGDVERASKAYKDMHNHTHNEPEKALPLFRLMTWVDPGFVEGWTTGSMVLARDRGEKGTDKAIDFLQQGLAASPQSIDLHTQMGYLLITRRGDLENAVKFLNQARELGQGRKGQLSDEERDAFNESYRWLALCYRDMARLPEMRRVVAEGLREFSDDLLLRELKDQPPIILSLKGLKERQAIRR